VGGFETVNLIVIEIIHRRTPHSRSHCASRPFARLMTA
jgi:hypothetical protein